MSAPVQVLVLGFEEATFSGVILEELVRLREAEVVRLVGLLTLARDENGGFDTLEPPAGVDPALVRAAVALLDGDEEDHDEPAEGEGWSLTDVIAPGSVAAIALIEHTWAVPLVGAIDVAGGRLLGDLWLSPEDRVRLSGQA